MDPNSASNVFYVFEPNTKEIFCDILPRRLFEESVYVKEIDLYAIDLSPQKLLYYYGGGGDVYNLYFLTILKKKTEKKYNRVVGSSGTWNNRRKDPCSLEIDGLDMIVGEKRLFNFTYSRNEDSAQDKEAGIKWIMREYAMEDGYINYLFKKHNLDYANNGDLIERYKNVVFCHIYKKVDKKRRREHFNTIIKHNRICVNEDQQSSQLQEHNSGELTTTIDNGHLNYYGELTATTMGSGHSNTDVTNAHAHYLQFINNGYIEFNNKTLNELPRPCPWIPVPHDVPRQFSNIYDAQPYPEVDLRFMPCVPPM